MDEVTSRCDECNISESFKIEREQRVSKDLSILVMLYIKDSELHAQGVL